MPKGMSWSDEPYLGGSALFLGRRNPDIVSPKQTTEIRE